MYKLLLVDDEKQIREGLRGIIRWEDYGIQVCAEASGGDEALRMIRYYHPQIVITDIQMPGGTGLELLANVRRFHEPCETIVLSGYDDYDLVRQAMRSGAVDYLLKPSSRQDLIAIIDEVTDRIENRQKNGSDAEYLMRVTNTVRRYAEREITAMEFRNRLEVLEYPLIKEACVVAILTCPHPGEAAGSEEEFKDWLFRLCCNYFSNRQGEGPFFDTKGNVCLLLRYGNPQVTEEDCRRLGEQIRSECGQQPELTFGSACMSYRTIPTSYSDAEKSRSQKQPQQMAFSRAVRQMLNAINTRYSDPDLSIPYLAEEMKGSAPYLGRLFKKETGKSFNEYLSDTRIEEGRKLLVSTNLKGEELSRQVGFSNYNYFYLVFKKKIGMNPMDYRRCR